MQEKPFTSAISGLDTRNTAVKGFSTSFHPHGSSILFFGTFERCGDGFAVFAPKGRQKDRVLHLLLFHYKFIDSVLCS